MHLKVEILASNKTMFEILFSSKDGCTVSVLISGHFSISDPPPDWAKENSQN